jgi:riboflavin synthase
MFTGIVQKTAKVISAESRGKSRIVHIEKPAGWRVKHGASIAVNGVCSTMRASGASYMEFEYMPETLSKTTSGIVKKGDVVNLERSLRLHEVVDGHFVQGHVDARGEVIAVRTEGASKELFVRVPRSLMRFVALKGSVTVNGVSLTVHVIKGDTFGVSLVSHTLAHTNLGMLKKGSLVNVEVDLIARYLARLTGR